ncbi:hypothetical protein GALL_152150 [mine drainage metagenome]|uniref:Uncharacterized protein n=1 Tax=mine drainage metagenome TaxID=410659 RepID=A0A1J5S2Y5_9ZZZZ
METKNTQARPQTVMYEIQRARDGKYCITYFSAFDNKWLSAELTAAERVFFLVFIQKVGDRILQSQIDAQTDANNPAVTQSPKRPLLN